MKNPTDFRKTVENGMDPRLILISKTGHQKIPFTFKELEFKNFYHEYFWSMLRGKCQRSLIFG